MGLYNRVKFTTSTTGTGTVTVGSAVSKFRTPAQASIPNGMRLSYLIEEGNNWETGYGFYTVSGTTLSRNVRQSSNSNSLISLGGNAIVTILGLAEDFIPDLGAISLYTRPAVVNTEDDMFDTGSLDSKWTGWNSPTLDWTTMPGWIGVGGGECGITQAVPAGDWIIDTEVLIYTTTNTTSNDAGFLLSTTQNAASSTGAHFLIFRDGTGTVSWQFQKITNNSFTSQYTGSPQTGFHSLLNNFFMRIQKSSTTYTCSFSSNGKQYFRVLQETALGFTPSFFGFRTGGAFFNYFVRR